MPILREHEGSLDQSGLIDRAIGPFYSPQGVLRRLGIDLQSLGGMVRNVEVLALPTAEGDMVYPQGQFITSEDGRIIVNPAISPAMNFLMENDHELVELLVPVDPDPYGLLWTIAGALLEPNEQGEILLHTLQQHLSDSDHESWQRLADLNGILSKVRASLAEEDSDE